MPYKRFVRNERPLSSIKENYVEWPSYAQLENLLQLNLPALKQNEEFRRLTCDLQDYIRRTKLSRAGRLGDISSGARVVGLTTPTSVSDVENIKCSEKTPLTKTRTKNKVDNGNNQMSGGEGICRSLTVRPASLVRFSKPEGTESSKPTQRVHGSSLPPIDQVVFHQLIELDARSDITSCPTSPPSDIALISTWSRCWRYGSQIDPVVAAKLRSSTSQDPYSTVLITWRSCTLLPDIQTNDLLPTLQRFGDVAAIKLVRREMALAVFKDLQTACLVVNKYRLPVAGRYITLSFYQDHLNYDWSLRCIPLSKHDQLSSSSIKNNKQT